jgi:pimeloyl-ACP methyl ester carboxylesterase
MRGRPEVTIDLIKRARSLLPIAKTVTLDKDTWLPFERTLRSSIEQQTTLVDAEHVKSPMVVVYGTLDPVIIKSYIRELKAKHGNCKIVKVRGSTHHVDKRFASAIAKEIMTVAG